MNQKQNEILSYLNKNNERWSTATELSSFCGCTTRTIRNRIATINQELPGIVLSSNNGYKVNLDIHRNEKIVSEISDRKPALFLLLLKNSSTGIDLYDLAEKLFISESTLKNDIQELKKLIGNPELNITIENDAIKLTGSERSKRKYLVSLLYKEGDFQKKIRASIQELVGYISLEELQKLIQSTLSCHNVILNQYSLNNIVLHFAISIERIRQGHMLQQSRPNRHVNKSPEYFITEEIAQTIANRYEVQFTTAELEQLALLFIGMGNETSAKNKEKRLSDFVDERIICALKAALKQVEETYLIDLGDSDFFNKLAIHLQSLYYRSHYETFTRNSSLLDIKTSYPLTYDISVYISSLVQEELDIWFNDDEISFIALHVGSFLETKKSTKGRIVLLLVVNDYHDIKAQILERLASHLGPEVKIVSAELNEVPSQTFDILLTTDRNVVLEHPGAIFIRPFLTEKDLQKVDRRIAAKRRTDEKKLMYRYVEKFVSEKLYFNQIDPADLTPAEIRSQISKRMLAEGYVNQQFFHKVEKREEMSPTSFPSGIAIPHSVELDALESGVSIMTLQEPILWADYPVRMVALIAINQEESKEFNAFFEKFVEIVSEPVNTKQLAMSEDFDAFILRFKTMIDMEEVDG